MMKNIFAFYFYLAIFVSVTSANLTISCINCYLGNCTCITNCDSGSFNAYYARECTGFPNIDLSFTNGSVRWYPSQIGIYYLKIFCDDDRISNCTSLQINSSTNLTITTTITTTTPTTTLRTPTTTFLGATTTAVKTTTITLTYATTTLVTTVITTLSTPTSTILTITTTQKIFQTTTTTVITTETTETIKTATTETTETTRTTVTTAGVIDSLSKTAGDFFYIFILLVSVILLFLFLAYIFTRK